MDSENTCSSRSGPHCARLSYLSKPAIEAWPQPRPRLPTKPYSSPGPSRSRANSLPASRVPTATPRETSTRSISARRGQSASSRPRARGRLRQPAARQRRQRDRLRPQGKHVRRRLHRAQHSAHRSGHEKDPRPTPTSRPCRSPTTLRSLPTERSSPATPNGRTAPAGCGASTPTAR